MAQVLHEFASRLQRSAAAWLHARCEESRHCADCDAAVSPWDDLCPGCGLANPARVNLSWRAYLAIGACCLLVLTLVAVFN